MSGGGNRPKGRVLFRATHDTDDEVERTGVFWICAGGTVGRLNAVIFPDGDVSREFFKVQNIVAGTRPSTDILFLRRNVTVARMEDGVRRNFTDVDFGSIPLHTGDFIRCGGTTLEIIDMEEAAGEGGETLPPHEDYDDVLMTQAEPDEDEGAQRAAAARGLRFVAKEGAAAAAAAPLPAATMNVDAPLPTPPRNRGNKAAQNKRRRQREAAELRAARERDPVAAAQAAAMAVDAGREAKLKERAQAAIAVGDIAKAGGLLAQLQRLKGGPAHQKRGKKRGRGTPHQPHQTDKSRRKQRKNKAKKAQQRRNQQDSSGNSGRQQRRGGGRGRSGQSQRQRSVGGADKRKRKKSARSGNARHVRMVINAETFPEARDAARK